MMDGRAFGTATGPAPIMADRTLPSLHTGESDFLAIRGDQCLYVDKTSHLRGLLAVRPASAAGHIPSLENKHQFLAWPRRFGKSLLINTAWRRGSRGFRPTTNWPTRRKLPPGPEHRPAGVGHAGFGKDWKWRTVMACTAGIPSSG